MKKSLSNNLLFLSLALFLSYPCSDAQAIFSTINKGFADVVEPLLPAVVNISTTADIPKDRSPELPNIPENHPFYEFFKQFMEEHYSKRPRKATALGSGFIIDAEGYIVTNNHVIAEATEITVTLNNAEKTELKAKVIGRDPRTDLALIKVEPKKPLTPITWGDSKAARVGDWVIAVGNPFGLSSSVTVGVISTIARDISAQSRGGAERADIVDGYIQTDASINLGNSGGPMINTDGQVIGINTAILSPSGTNIGIGFAIPSEVAKPVIEQLKTYGRTKRGWLGVRVQAVTEEIAEALSLKEAHGALIGSITEDGPAAKAGVKPRDVILSFNGKLIGESRNLPRIVGDTEIGKEVPITVWRDGKELNMKVKVGEFEAAEEAGLIPSQRVEEETVKKSKEILGMTLREILPQDRATNIVPNDAKGVLIINIDPYSEAYEKKGLRSGDIIVDVGSKPVSKPEEVIEYLAQARKKNKKVEIFQIRRAENVLFIALNIQEESKDKKEEKPVKPENPGKKSNSK